jgi:hypothetical protein
MYNDISIPVSPLHFTETYTDETNLRRYTGDSFENIELAQEYWDLEAKKWVSSYSGISSKTIT